MNGPITRLVIPTAWVAIIAVACATLTPVGFVYAVYYKLALGPEMRTYGHFVHIIAFAVLGALFAFAYPKRTLLVGCIVLGGAALLEIAQTLTPDRHGTFIDAFEKIAGGAAGILLARTIQHLRGKRTIIAD